MRRSKGMAVWRMRWLSAALVAAAAMPLPSQALADPAACPGLDAAGAPLGEPVEIAHVVAGDEVQLADGRTVRLADVAAARDPLAGPRPPDHAAAVSRAALVELLGSAQAVRFVPIAPARIAATAATTLDRYGRVVGRLIVLSAAPTTGPDQPVLTWADVAVALAGRGVVRYQPVAAWRSACFAAVRAADGAARAAGAGLMATPAYATRDAGAPDLTQSAGAAVAVEGRVVSLGHAGRTTYVNFGDDFARDFTAWLSDKDRQAWLSAGVDVATWPGQRVRLYGILTPRDGGSMRLTDAGQVERLPQMSNTAGAGPGGDTKIRQQAAP